jgi:hypothetical protein
MNNNNFDIVKKQLEVFIKEQFIKKKLDYLIKINLLEFIGNSLIKKIYEPLVRILRTYKNLKDRTEIGVPYGIKNIDIWNFMCSNKYTIDYLSRSEINLIIIMASLYYEKNYSKRKINELLIENETKVQKLNI